MYGIALVWLDVQSVSKPFRTAIGLYVKSYYSFTDYFRVSAYKDDIEIII